MPQDDNTLPGSSPEETRETPGSPPDAATTPPATLEDLAAQFADESDDPAPDAPPSQPPAPAAGTEGDGKPADNPKPTKTTPAAASAAAAAAATPAKPADDAPDDSYPDEQELQAIKTPNARRRIEQLVAARKRLEAEADKLRERAAYRDQLDETLAREKIDPNAWDQWTQLGLVVQRDPERAATILAKMAEGLGYKPAAPAADADTALDTDLAEAVDKYEMTEAAAKRIQEERRTRAPAQPLAGQQPPAGQQPIGGPRLIPTSQDQVQTAATKVAAVAKAFQTKYGAEWDKLVPEVEAEMARYKGSPPHLWEQIARDCAERVVAKRIKPPPPPDPGLRPAGSGRGHGSEAPSWDGLAEKIASGDAFRR